MGAASTHLAFDLGASGGRAVLGRFDGRRLALEEIHRFENGPLRLMGRLHWDAPRLLREIMAGLTRCAGAGIRLDSLGIDTWGVDFGLLSKSGELLGLPYHYRDSRSRGQLARVLELIDRDELYARTGILCTEFNTLYQLLALRDSDLQLLAAAHTLLLMPDLLAYWLTGQRRSERTIASTSQLLAVDGRRWESELFALLDLPVGIMPAIDEPATPRGPLIEAVCSETGLSAAQVIAPAGHDTACAVAAVPRRPDDRRSWAYISCGTWSVVGVELDSPVATPAAQRAGFTNERGAAGTVRLLTNLAGLWLLQECRRTWAARGEQYSFADLTRLAAAAPAQRALIDPDDPQFITPGDMPRRIRDWCRASGQPVPENPGQLVRCVLESLALKHDRTLRRLEALTGRRIEVVHLVGGGSRNELLCQLTADAAGKPVLAGPAEATAAGNIMLQAQALGLVGSLGELRAVLAESTKPVGYEPAADDRWSEARARFAALLDDGRPVGGENRSR